MQTLPQSHGVRTCCAVSPATSLAATLTAPCMSFSPPCSALTTDHKGSKEPETRSPKSDVAVSIMFLTTVEVGRSSRLLLIACSRGRKGRYA